MTTDLLIPGLTLICGVAGGFAGARGAIVRLETQMKDVRERLEMMGIRSHRHNDTLLVHDAEIDLALTKLGIPRLRRQSMLE